DMHDARRLQHELRGAANDVVRPRQRAAGWQLDDGDQVALVLRGNEAGGRARELPARQADQAGIDDEHQDAQPDQAPRGRGVGVRHTRERPVEAAEEGKDWTHEKPWPRWILDMRLEQDGAHRRAQRQRQKAGDDGRGSDRDRELAEKLAGDARYEGGRDEHRRQHDGDGDEGGADLVHGAVRRLPRRHARAQVALDVLDHDDGVVDHDADRQHEPEQRQVVEREAERRQDGEGADQRDRNGDDRDDGGAPGLQKQDHDEDDQSDGLEDGVLYRIDGLGDEVGGVVDDVVAQAAGEILRQIVHRRKDSFGGGEGIGAGALE